MTGGFFVLNALLNLLVGTEQQAIALVGSTAVVVGLFTPTLKQVRHFVDRRLYGIELDYSANIRKKREHQALGRPSKIQSSFKDYTRLQLLGQGGMGEVYLAQTDTTNQLVALKILSAKLITNDEARHRFLREARVIAQLQHPNIVQMVDYGEADGNLYMIKGKDLSELLEEHGKLSVDQVCSLMQGIASALDYAHQHNIVHREIKPSNIMVEMDDRKPVRPVLMDFGIARILGGMTQLTGTGVVGTLNYISPEQIQGEEIVDERADIYSLGAMTYELLTGEIPFKQNNPAAMLLAHLMQPPPDLSEKIPDLSPAVISAVYRAMAKQPDSRFDTAEEFAIRLCS